MKQYIMTFILSFFVVTFTIAQDLLTPEQGPTTTMQFEETVFDWGTIDEGDKISHIFTFTNTGDLPLIIKDAKGSCGCTVPVWPKDPILPGEKAVLEVQFNSKGKPGMQNKRITITANTDPAQTYLNIKGEVLKTTSTEAKDKEFSTLIEPAATLENSNFEKPISKDCFAIFPNPTTDVLKLDLKEHIGKNAIIEIFDASGTLMNMKPVNEVTDEIIEFNVQNYNAGTYYVKINIDKKSIATKCFVVAN